MQDLHDPGEFIEEDDALDVADQLRAMDQIKPPEDQADDYVGEDG